MFQLCVGFMALSCNSILCQKFDHLWLKRKCVIKKKIDESPFKPENQSENTLIFLVEGYHGSCDILIVHVTPVLDHIDMFHSKKNN